jgi:hypothetical protein
MDVLAEIKQKLLSGKQPKELVKESYAKSSVYSVAKKIRDAQLGMPELPLGDEVAELRRRKEIIKLEKEIADLEAGKERLPERVTELEHALQKTKDSILDIWTEDILEYVIARLSCPKHGQTMGIVFQCRECDYKIGLGWRT